MHRRRVLGIGLALASLALLAFLFAANPPPDPYERWVEGKDPRGALLVARGPAVAAYNETEDLTFALFFCGHARCPSATTIQGDAREATQRTTVLLFAPLAPAPRDEEPMPAPLRANSTQGPQVVANATAARFELGSASFSVALYHGAMVLVVVGALLALPGLSPTLGALGAGAGVVVGSLFGPTTGLIVGPFLGFVALTVGAIAAVAKARWKHGKEVATFAIPFGLLLLAAAALTSQYFAHPPLD